MNFALQIPQFHKITGLAKTIPDAHYCHTFGFMEHECNYTLASFHSEQRYLSDLIRQYNLETDYLDNDLSALTIQTTSKRALLDISGFLGSLFGTASQAEIKELEGKLFNTAIYAKHNHDNIASLFEFLTTFKNNTYANFKDIQAHVSATNAALLTSIKRMDNLTTAVSAMKPHLDRIDDDLLIIRSHDQLVTTTQRLIQQVYTMSNALNDLKIFREQIQLLLQGRLPYKLVTLSTIDSAVKRLSLSLDKHNLSPLPAKNNNRYFYNYAHAIGYVARDALIITIEIPVFAPDHIINVHKITAYPVPLHTQDGNDPNNTSLLKVDKSFIAFSKDKHKFGYLSQAEYSACEHTDFVCQYPTFMYSHKTTDCIFNIMVNHNILPTCEFSTKTSTPYPNVLKVDHSKYLLQNLDSPIRITCDNKPDSFHKINSHVILSLSCGCFVHNAAISIAPQPDDCDNVSESVQLDYPINIAQFRTIKIPGLNTNVTNAKKVVQSEPRLYDSIKSILSDEYVKADVPLQFDNTNDLGPALFTPKFETDLSEIVTSVVMITWNTCLSVAVLILFFRFRTATMLALAASGAGTAESYVISNVTPPTPTDPLTSHVDTIARCLIVITCVILAISTVVLFISPLVSTYIKKPKAPNQEAALYVKIFNSSNTCLVKLCDIPLDDKLKYDAIPELQNYFVSWSGLLPTININWIRQLSFTYRDTKQLLPLPRHVRIPFHTSLILHSINTSPYTTFYAVLFRPLEDTKYYVFEKITAQPASNSTN